MKKTARQSTPDYEAITGRLDALVAFLAPIMRTVVKARSAVEAAEGKAARALYDAGVPQHQVARLLGVDNNRANELLRKGGRKGKLGSTRVDGTDSGN